MKNSLKFKTLYVVLFVLAVCILIACSKKETKYDITGDNTNRVYVNTETSYVNNYT